MNKYLYDFKLWFNGSQNWPYFWLYMLYDDNQSRRRGWQTLKSNVIYTKKYSQQPAPIVIQTLLPLFSYYRKFFFRYNNWYKIYLYVTLVTIYLCYPWYWKYRRNFIYIGFFLNNWILLSVNTAYCIFIPRLW